MSEPQPDPTSSGRRQRRRMQLRRGAYLLPSLFTIGNILLGFYAIVRGLHGGFERAALLIFAAGILDALDGRVARLTHTESEFGKEFDSLADVLTFGAAPALLAYLWGLQSLGRIGWLVALYFLLCTAIRLARFNVQTRSVDSRYFVGLPSPAAAGTVASFLFFAPDPDWRLSANIAMVVGLLSAGTLMVSTFRYPSFKKIDLRARRSYRSALPIAVVVLVAAYRPTAFFLTVALIFAAWGPLTWLIGRLRRTETPPDTVAEERETREAS